jgi:hypothetical protein
MKAKTWLIAGLAVVNVVLIGGLIARTQFGTPAARAAVNLQGVRPLTVAGRSGNDMILWFYNVDNGLLTAVETPGNAANMGRFAFTRSVKNDIRRVKAHLR